MFALKILAHFCSGLWLVITAYVIFRTLTQSDEIGALLTIAFSDLYFGRFAK